MGYTQGLKRGRLLFAAGLKQLKGLLYSAMLYHLVIFCITYRYYFLMQLWRTYAEC